MASTIRCDIVSAEAEIFHGEAELVVATGELGELGIAPKHAPLITRLKPGKVVVTIPGGEKLDFAISGGILEVQPTVVTVLADTAIRAQDIDEAAVRAAKEEAERIIAHRGEKMDIAEAQQKLVEVTVQRGANLVRRLLAIARQQPLEAHPIDVGALLLGMVHLLRGSLPESISIRTRLGSSPNTAEVSLWALTDPGQLEDAVPAFSPLPPPCSAQARCRAWTMTRKPSNRA